MIQYFPEHFVGALQLSQSKHSDKLDEMAINYPQYCASDRFNLVFRQRVVAVNIVTTTPPTTLQHRKHI